MDINICFCCLAVTKSKFRYAGDYYCYDCITPNMRAEIKKYRTYKKYKK